MVKLPKRYSCWGVGKNIGLKIYVHKNYEHMIPGVNYAKSLLLPDFDYTVVSYSPSTGTITFTECCDFDTADEPSVGDQIVVKSSGIFRKILSDKENPWIYHHKWLFVKDDYTGFDVEVSKHRSEEWMKMSDIDYTRIGKKKFWECFMRMGINQCQQTKN